MARAIRMELQGIRPVKWCTGWSCSGRRWRPSYGRGAPGARGAIRDALPVKLSKEDVFGADGFGRGVRRDELWCSGLWMAMVQRDSDKVVLGCWLVIGYIGQLVLTKAGGWCGFGCCGWELLVPRGMASFRRWRLMIVRLMRRPVGATDGMMGVKFSLWNFIDLFLRPCSSGLSFFCVLNSPNLFVAFVASFTFSYRFLLSVFSNFPSLFCSVLFFVICFWWCTRREGERKVKLGWQRHWFFFFVVLWFCFEGSGVGGGGVSGCFEAEVCYEEKGMVWKGED